jgi:hypothetical protein
MQYLANCQNIMIIHLAILGYCKRGIVASLHPSSHEQNPFDNLGQNESTHGVL